MYKFSVWRHWCVPCAQRIRCDIKILARNTSDVNELEAYFNEPCIRPHQNPMEWWKSNGDRYKKLSVLAKQHLVIPATSVPAERVFSAAGLIVNRMRSRLSPEHVDMLVFLTKNWFRFSHNVSFFFLNRYRPLFGDCYWPLFDAYLFVIVKDVFTFER